MIIFNADDYALTQGDVTLVGEAIKTGIIRSTTVVANGLSCMPLGHTISCGIHINLVEGCSLTAGTSMTDPIGHFLPKRDLLKKLTIGGVSFRDLEREIRAQFEMLLSSGYAISHIDTHQNIHIFPIILKAVIQVGEDFGVRKIRGQHSEYQWFGKYNSIKAFSKSVFANYWHRILPRNWVATERIVLNAPGLGRNANSINEAIELWRTALTQMYDPRRIYEVPCHLHLSPFEFELYTSVEFSLMIRKLGIVIGSYHDI